MENKLKLSQKLSFRGWPQDYVSELLKLETDNEELKIENKKLNQEIWQLREDIRVEWEKRKKEIDDNRIRAKKNSR